MRLAFYAPMKSPEHPVPSGDRAIARALMAALRSAGAKVDLASNIRIRDGAGVQTVQQSLMAEAAAALPDIIARGQQAGWRAWITYHNYYKAPDLLGPLAARGLGIPYVQIESTRARKRLQGPWAGFARKAEAATDAAALVFYFSQRDAEALQRDAPTGQNLQHLHPFLTRKTLPPASPLTGPILSVAMMRAGDKLASYKIIAETLAQMPDTPWQIEIAGDGPVRRNVEAMMAPFGNRVRFLGQLAPAELQVAYQKAGMFLWPGVNEALGMAYLEAQAAGLPVIAQDRPGMRDVLADGAYPAPEAGAPALASRLNALLHDRALRSAAGATARQHMEQHHLMPQAAATLMSGLAGIGVGA